MISSYNHMELIPGLTNHLARECLIRVPFQSFRSMLSVCKAWNLEIQSPYFHFLRRLSGHTRPVFVLSQGSSDPSQTTSPYTVTVFDQERGSFTKLPPGPDLPAAEAVLCRVAGVGSTVVVFISGVSDEEQTNIGVHVFDFSTGQWRNGVVMPGPGRVFYGLASDPVGGMVLIAGGIGGDYMTPMRSALLYDVASDTWKAVADMENERLWCDVMFHSGRFHAVNGLGQSRERCLVAESLDHDTWRWGPHAEGDQFVEAYLHTVQLIMENGQGDVYRYYLGRRGDDDSLEVRRGGEWWKVLDLPREIRLIDLVSAMMWRDTMLLVEFHEGTSCCWAYILDLKSFGWTKVPLPEYFKADVSNLVYGCGMDL